VTRPGRLRVLPRVLLTAGLLWLGAGTSAMAPPAVRHAMSGLVVEVDAAQHRLVVSHDGDSRS
jgi:hypothetical protein